MTSKLLFQDPSGFATPLLVVFAVDIATGKDDQASPALLTTSDALAAAAAPWLGSGEFKATLGEQILLRRPEGVKAERLLIVGLGKAKALTANELRKASGAAIRLARPRAHRDLAIAFPEDRALADEHIDTLPCYLAARALAEGAVLADFDIDTYRNDRKDLSIHSITVLFQDGDDESRKDLQRGWDEGIILGESQNFTRALVNEPSNVLTPTELGRRASAMAKEHGLSLRGALDGQDEGAQDGRLPRRRARLRRTPGTDRAALRADRTRPPLANKAPLCSGSSARASPSIPAASPSNPPTTWTR